MLSDLGAKHRPTIILKVSFPPCKYLVVECSTFKDKHKSMKGIKISNIDNTKEFQECGFDETTFITQNKCWVKEGMLHPHPTRGDNPIGKCNFLDQINGA